MIRFRFRVGDELTASLSAQMSYTTKAVKMQKQLIPTKLLVMKIIIYMYMQCGNSETNARILVRWHSKVSTAGEKHYVIKNPFQTAIAKYSKGVLQSKFKNSQTTEKE